MKAFTVRELTKRATALVAVAGLGLVAFPATAAATSLPAHSEVSVRNLPIDEDAIVNLTAPVLALSTESSQTLTATDGTWDTAETLTVTYEWLRDGSVIAGAIGNTYALTEDDSGHALTVRVTVTVGSGETAISGSAVSNEIEAVADPTIVTHPVTLLDTNGVLSVVTEAWTLSDDDAKLVTEFTYVWHRGETVIAGATAATYQLTEADAGQNITVTVTGVADGYADAVVTSAAFVVPPAYVLPASTRIAGADRFETAVKISESAFEADSVDTVVLATGYGFADALSAAPLAKILGGPLLLTQQDQLTEVTAKEIQRLNPETVIIIGGDPSVGEEVREELDELKFQTVRVAGDDRFETSRMIAEMEDVWSEEGTPEVFIATGMNFPDALAAGAAAAGVNIPVLLVNGEATSLSPEQVEQLESFKTVTAYIAGSNVSVSKGIEAQLEKLDIDVTRFAGKDRIETSALIAQEFGTAEGAAYIAQGWNYPDALSGAAVAGINGSALVLSQQNCFSPGLVQPLTELRVSSVTLLGSEASLNTNVANYTTKCS